MKHEVVKTISTNKRICKAAQKRDTFRIVYYKSEREARVAQRVQRMNFEMTRRVVWDA